MKQSDNQESDVFLMNLPYKTIFDIGDASQFWEFVKYFLFLVGPIVMIWVAIELVRRLVSIVRGSTENADDDLYYEKRRRNDDDDYYY